MSDTDVIVEMVTRHSILDRLPADLDNPDPTDLDRLTASLDYLALTCCKPDADESEKHLPLEALAADERLLVNTVPTVGEQL